MLALADETAELLLPKAEAGRNAGSAPPPVVSAGQQTFINASTASPAARSVITAGAARTDGAQPADGSVNNANDGGADASQAGAASDSSGSSGGSSGGSSSGGRPSLGISGHMLSFEKQQELGLQQTGLLVTAVRRSDIDVQVDDVVLAIDGQTFSSTREALAIIRDVQSGSVQLTVFRSGSQLTVTVNLS